jgi:hypothetical protein
MSEPLSKQLREHADSFNGDGFFWNEGAHPELYRQAADEIDRVRHALQTLMDAAEAFLAEPDARERDSKPCNQYTTAGDCRALNRAYREAAEAAKLGKMSS